jgi:membrane-anchored mycosin MYCP
MTGGRPGALRVLVIAGLLGIALVPPAGGPAVAAPVGCRNPAAAGQPLPATAPRDPTIARLGLERAWELSTGAGVTVAMVDSGVDAQQPKLGGALVPGYDFVSTQAPPGFSRQFGGLGDCGDNGATHGTAVAGLIAARAGRDDRVVGVAPGARIASVRIVDGVGNSSTQLIAAAIRSAAELGQVLNLSLAVPVDYPVIRQAIQYARSRDVVVVAAAGNESSGSGAKWYPAAYPGVLAVAALKLDGSPLQESNSGPWIRIAAPGEGLTAPAAVTGYVGVTGTSFATALVSGVAALVRARFPRLPAAAVIARLAGTAVPLGATHDDRVGAGIVDPFAALTAQTVDPDPDPDPGTGPGPGSGTGSNPGAGTQASAGPAGPAAVQVQPRPAQPPSLAGRWGRLLGAAGGLALAAVLAYLARLAIRAALRRRRWPTGEPSSAAAADRALEPPDVRLV